MPDFDFMWNVSTVINGAIRVAVILLAVFVLLKISRRVIVRVITTRIPKIREEEPGQLATRSETLARTIVQAVTVIVWIIAGVMILGEIGVNIGPIVAALGLASLALGFAAQGIIRDYLNGLYIVMEDWYRVGEVITVAGIGGIVEDFTLRRTVLRDLDGTLHSIPNSKVEMASNLTRDWGRINLNVSVGYGENLDRVIEVMNEVCVGLKDDPVWGMDLLNLPQVERVDKLGDSGIEIKILGETKPIRQWALAGELRKRLKDRFDIEDIEIPWPHTKVYFGNPLDSGKPPVQGKS